MRLVVLGSGSRGNAVALTAGGAVLLVDAGFGTRTLARRAEAAGLPLERLVGVVLTHEHGDHARGAAQLARRVGCAVYGSPGTLAALRHRLDGVRTVTIEVTQQPVTIAPFRVATCAISHDAAEPLAVCVEASGHRVGVAYDVGRPTAGLRRLLRACHCLVVETNHDDVMLRAAPYPATVRDRIAGAGGHLSNRAAADLVAELCHDGLHTVVLAHLSERCNEPALALAAMREALRARRFRGRLVVAHQGVPLEPIEVAAGEQLDLV